MNLIEYLFLFGLYWVYYGMQATVWGKRFIVIRFGPGVVSLNVNYDIVSHNAQKTNYLILRGIVTCIA